MRRSKHKAIAAVDKLPTTPGVYFFSGRRGLLYIGKATSLRDRVRSYFRGDLAETRGPHFAAILDEIERVEHKTADSVLEALISEANLIRQHKPPFNVQYKDDKSFLYVGMTREPFPRVLLLRGKDLEAESLKLKALFGPFPHAGELRAAMKILRRLFPYHDHHNIPATGGTDKPCFNAQIGLCPGVCAGLITRAAYRATIRDLTNFLRGEKKRVLAHWERDMADAAARQDFERAALLRNKIFALQHIHDVALVKRQTDRRAAGILRIEAYDIAHTVGRGTTGAMVVVENGEVKKADYRLFRLRGAVSKQAHDTGNLAEVLRRRLNHPEWPWPQIVVVDGAVAQRRLAERLWREAGLGPTVVAVTKDERHKPKAVLGPSEIVHPYERAILLANQEAHRFVIAYHRKLRGRMVQSKE